jgi:K+-sensing histidine kinase KdpD
MSAENGTVTGGSGETGAGLSPGRVRAGWALALGGAAALTAVLLTVRQGPSPSFEAMLYLGLAVVCALVGGRWPALTASVLGVLLLNYFFTAPVHTLSIAGPENVATLLLFVVLSIAVASVVDSAARRHHQAMVASREAGTLAMLNRTVLGAEYDVPGLLRLVARTFGAERAELLPAGSAVDAADSAAPAGRGTVLVLRRHTVDASERRILTAFGSHLGMLAEREGLARQAQSARELEAGNRTRTALLAAVSHDLRTPLAGLRASAETLRLHGERLPPGERAELLGAIEESTDRLTALVTDLLDMSRLQTGAVQPVLVDAPLGDVVAKALVGLPTAAHVCVEAVLAPVVADVALLERVLANLLANAVRYSERVAVRTATLGQRVRVEVVDHGPGVPDADKARIFEPFQRLGDERRDAGVGLGLAVARGLTEAQGGTLVAEDTPGGGLTMVVELAAGEEAP